MVDDIPICGVIVADMGALGKWPGANPQLPWYLDTAGYKGNISQADLIKAYELAWSYWAQQLEIGPFNAFESAKAIVRAHFARIDGSSGVLAWSELANNTTSPKTQRYDNGEGWVVSPDSAPQSGIDLVRVAAHEIGHVLGLGHDSASADALMRPSYSTRIPKPTSRDIERMINLGYKKRATTSPPNPPSPPTVPPIHPVDPDPPPVPRPPLAGQVHIDIDKRIVSVPSNWTVTRHG